MINTLSNKHITNTIIDHTRIYLYNWPDDDSKKLFLKYRRQNRFIIKDRSKYENLPTFTSEKDKIFKEQSNFIIYYVRDSNYNKEYERLLMRDLNYYTFKGIVFIPDDSLKVISSVEFNIPDNIPVMTNLVGLTDTIFFIRIDSNSRDYHNDNGNKLDQFNDYLNWEYV